jgi:hypothetical protein
MVKSDKSPKLITIPPISKAAVLSKNTLLIPAKRQNGSAIKKRLKSIEYGVSERAIIIAGKRKKGIKCPRAYLLNETTIIINNTVDNSFTSGCRR